jgi:hypothetical protein
MDDKGSDELGAAVPSPADTPKTRVSSGNGWGCLATLVVILMALGYFVFAWLVPWMAWSMGTDYPVTKPSVPTAKIVVVVVVVLILLWWIWRDRSPQPPPSGGPSDV